MNNSYVSGLLRFWWLLAIGIGLGALVAVGSVDKIKPGVPPKLTPRKMPTYSATAQIMIDSSDSPYFRTAVTRGAATTSGGTGSKAAAAASGTNARQQQKNAAAAATTVPPDTSVLVNAANLYPIWIQSDRVAEIRERITGPIDGTVVAQTAFARNAPFGNPKPSYLPLIVINATANTAKEATDLASGTVVAFKQFVKTKQNRSGVPASQRLLIEDITSPADPLKVSHSTMTLPGALFVLVLGAFGGLALLLDRKYPRPARKATAPVGATAETSTG